MTPEDAAKLESNYYFFSQLEKRLRIESDQPAAALPTKHDLLTPIARHLGYSGEDAAEQLLAEVESRRGQVRGLFADCFAREEKKTGA